MPWGEWQSVSKQSSLQKRMNYFAPKMFHRNFSWSQCHKTFLRDFYSLLLVSWTILSLQTFFLNALKRSSLPKSVIKITTKMLFVIDSTGLYKKFFYHCNCCQIIISLFGTSINLHPSLIFADKAMRPTIRVEYSEGSILVWSCL